MRDSKYIYDIARRLENITGFDWPMALDCPEYLIAQFDYVSSKFRIYQDIKIHVDDVKDKTDVEVLQLIINKLTEDMDND
jgi:hypothetical protein